MSRREIDVDGGKVLAYGHWGRPVIAFPSENGEVWDWESRGMVESLGELLDAGRAKLYCVPSFDRESWTRRDLSLEDRAQRHGHYEWWILTRLVPFVQADSNTHGMVATGASFGAYHAANFALKRADLFPVAICMSGVYDVSVQGGGARGDAVYFNNPMDYVAHLNGEHLDWLRREASLVLVCGQGQWEDTTGALDSTRRFAGLLGDKGIPCELDLWGHDVPHDWPSWRRQIAHHLSRFV
ncbi:MAG TPA: alpha/beta hydrolase-fold protein [Gaiellaceae bacterium]|nr:alpha/beta hydrolase-fold protein [Gaiellaceae bacterium]